MEDLTGKTSETQTPDQEQLKRQSRRKVLKTGAAMAPLALTLSTGNALATGNIAVSGAGCVSHVKQLSQQGHEALQIPKEHRAWMPADHVYEHPEQTEHFQDYNENHWDYLQKTNREDCSCLQSINAAEYISKTHFN